MNTLHLFAGTGGGIIADMMLGHTPVGAVEINPYCRKILKARQRDGWIPKFPIFKDVKRFNGTEISKRVDCVSGGFPCQDISCAGKGAGITGARSRLFYELTRICRNLRPRYIFLENSPQIINKGIEAVLAEISEMGYDAEWCCLAAADVGAWHIRNRWWCLCKARVSDTDDIDGGLGLTSCDCVSPEFAGGDMQTGSEIRGLRCVPVRKEHENEGKGWRAEQTGFQNHDAGAETATENRSDGTTATTETQRGNNAEGIALHSKLAGWWENEPRICRVADGVAHRLDRYEAIGNGQVPAAAVTAWQILYARINSNERFVTND